jgi:hypothetical protein
VDISWPNVLMYVGSMMFGWIIAKVLEAGLVVELEVSLRFTIYQPEVSHLHCS